MVILDVETNGLNPTKIHCMSYKVVADYDADIVTLQDYDSMRGLFGKYNGAIIGHNIQRYDVVVLEKLLGVEIKNQLVDTLSLSWYLYPERSKHGLESWGETLGVKKVVVDDWLHAGKELYQERCEVDVEINSLLWGKMNNKLHELYDESDVKVDKFLQYLEFKMDCAREQERSRWKLDVEKATKGLEELSLIKEEKVEQLKGAMPRVPIISKRSRPKKPFKADGTRSALGEKWFGLLRERSLPENYSGFLEITTGYKEPNPNSHDQIKDWLYSFGWKPETFKYVRNKKTGDVKKIPQVNLPKNGGICPSIKRLYVKEPALEVLEGLSVVSHRLTILKGFLKEVDDEGYVKAEIQGLTNTLRFKHAVCVNLPGVSSSYGKLIRGCLTAPEGYELCGADMASLEDRVGMHYLWEHDPAYVRKKMADDYDPHLNMAVMAGLMSEEDAEGYKKGDRPARLKKIRSTAKNAAYALTYGAGVATVARAAGISQKEAKLLHETYWKINWAVRAVPKNITVKKLSDGSMWLLNPLSGFWYSLRTEKDIWSTLVQGSGVYVFDKWIAYVFTKRKQLTATFHDEIVLTVKKGYQEGCTKLLKWAIQKVNEELKLNRELDIDVQYGSDYSQIH